ncbi:MAG TPA: TetR family transcriptional regulator [Burkholderiaceae bacterium]|nr:TetR family transcriptional regulator [Burkholderiaceae bacterium]
MVRRTKEEALETRNRLLDVAETLFQARGVSRTSLADIAEAAGVTRGAVYWHFENKADLFGAMIERVVLPIEETVHRIDAHEDPIAQIRTSIRDALRRAARDPQARRVFEIVSHKVEYVDEMSAARDRHLESRSGCLSHVERGLKLAIKQGQLAHGVNARSAAIGLHALMDGLIQNWMLAPDAFDLEREGARATDTYLTGLGAAL